MTIFAENPTDVKEISPAELKAWKDSGTPFQLIDIREEHEVAYCSIGGQHIPMGEVFSHLNELKTDIPVVLHCQSGRRSEAVAFAIEQKFGRSNLYSLSGGIQAWGSEIDNSLNCF